MYSSRGKEKKTVNPTVKTNTVENTKIEILRQFAAEGHSKATAFSTRDLGALVYQYDQKGVHGGQGVRECCECD